MRKVMANGNVRPANLWLVTTHACQSYLEDAKFMLTCSGPSRCYTTAKYLFLETTDCISKIVTWQNQLT